MKKDMLIEFYRYLKGRVENTSRKQYVSQMNLFFTKMKIGSYDGITPEVVKGYLESGLQQRVYARKYAILKFIEFMHDTQKIQSKEYVSLRKAASAVRYKVYDREGVKTATYEEIVQLVKTIEDPGLNLLIMLAFDSGARIRALLRIRKKDVIIRNEEIRVQLKEKGRKTPAPLITKETYIRFFEYTKEMGPDQFVFYPGKSALNMSDIDLLYNQYYKFLKIKSRDLLGKAFGMSWHWIRRGHAQYWKNKTGSLVAVQKQLGHSDINTTIRYLKAEENLVEQQFKNEKRPW